MLTDFLIRVRPLYTCMCFHCSVSVTKLRKVYLQHGRTFIRWYHCQLRYLRISAHTSKAHWQMSDEDHAQKMSGEVVSVLRRVLHLFVCCVSGAGLNSCIDTEVASEHGQVLL